MTLAYAPTTDLGRGLVPPLVKAWTHALVVYSAGVHNWPITNAEARAELEHAVAHLTDLNRAIEQSDWLSENTVTALAEWHSALTDLLESIPTEPRDDGLTDEVQTAIRTFGQQTFALLSILDNELLGLDATQTDPGRLP